MIVTPEALVGKRVLIVEDDWLVALLLEDFLIELGCTPVGPCSGMSDAMEAVRSEVFDLAVLEVNLNGERSYPVAEALTEQQIPFLIVTDYGEEAIPPGRSDWGVCTKPFKIDDLAAMLSSRLESEDPSARKRTLAH